MDRSLLKDIALLVLSAFILMFFALYDNFPIVTDDTGVYIRSGFEWWVPSDRPVFYGIFIRVTSCGASVWLTTFFQSLLVAFTITTFTRKLIPPISRFHLLAILVFLSLFTTCGWFTGMLMADIFVSIMILAVVSYVFFENPKAMKWLLLAIIFTCALMHNSNYVVLSLFSLGAFAAMMLVRSWRRYIRRVGMLALLCLFSCVLLCTANWVADQGFTTSKSTHVFVMGKLVESGVLKTYLDKACPEKEYAICAYKDNLPPVAWLFHWGEESPLQQTGGWDANRNEYNAIIRDIFSKPEYYPSIIYKSLEATARQLVLFNIDGNYALPWVNWGQDNPVYGAVKDYFPHEINQLEYSRMNQKSFSIGVYDHLFAIVIVLSVIAICFFLPGYIELKAEYLKIVWILAIMIVLNAFVTASLSSVNPRFNARVIWIVPFINVLFLLKMTLRKSSPKVVE